MFRFATCLILAGVLGLWAGRLLFEVTVKSARKEVSGQALAAVGENDPLDGPAVLATFERFRQMEEREVSSVLQALEDLSDDNRQEAIAGFLCGLAERDASQLPEAISGLGVHGLPVEAAFETAARYGLEDALALVPQLDAIHRDAALQGIARFLSSGSLERATVLIEGLGDEHADFKRLLSHRVALHFAAVLGPRILEHRLTRDLTPPHRPELGPAFRRQLESAALEGMAVSDPLRAAQLIRNGALSALSIEKEVMPCLASAPARLVFEVARLAEDAGAAIISTLKSTPGLTTQRVEELLESDMDPAIREKVLPWYVATANVSAEELLDFVNRSAVTDEAAKMILADSVREAIWAKRPDHAWLLASADEGLSESRHAVIEHYAEKDPYMASQLVEATGGWNEPDLIAGVVGKWSMADPAQAAMWLDSRPEDSGSLTKAHAYIAEMWSRADTYDASAWVAQLRPGPNRDAAIGGMVENLAGDDPDAARAWAESIEDEALREQQIEFLESFPRK